MLYTQAKAAELSQLRLSPAGSPIRSPEGTKALRIASPLGRQQKALAESAAPYVAPSEPPQAKAPLGLPDSSAKVEPSDVPLWPNQTSPGPRPGKRRRFAALSADDEAEQKAVKESG
jgi:hypothetical protein